MAAENSQGTSKGEFVEVEGVRIHYVSSAREQEGC